MGTGRNICPHFRKVKCSPHSAYREGGYTKLSDIELQVFVGNQLAYRNTGAVKTLCVRHPFIRITDCQDIDRLQVGGERKFLAKNIRLEVAYPDRTKPKLRGLKHHVIRQNGSVNVAGLLLIKGTNPCLIVISADDDSQRRPIDIGRLSNLCQSFLALNGNQVNRL